MEKQGPNEATITQDEAIDCHNSLGFYIKALRFLNNPDAAEEIARMEKLSSSMQRFAKV